MTIEEAIKTAESIAEENQRVIDTGIIFNDVTIDEFYCDDTEVIEEHLANYQRRANDYRQLAAWLKDYKRLLEQQPSDAAATFKDVVLDAISKIGLLKNDTKEVQAIAECLRAVEVLPPDTSAQKYGHWIAGKYKDTCSRCRCTYPKDIGFKNYCPNCGSKMQGVKE